MDDPRVIAILQARMGSTRLPGKVMKPIIEDTSALELMIKRVRRSQVIDELVVATSTSPDDYAIEALCRKLDCACFRGSEKDVLDRFHGAAKAQGVCAGIVRLTGDCPLHDPNVIDAVAGLFLDAKVDYASNVHPPMYPDGLDTEVFTFAALEAAWREARLLSEREHVTPYIANHPEQFAQANLRHEIDLSAHRWTLDEAADLAFVRAVYERLYPRNPTFGMNDVLQLLEDHPEIREMNQGIARNRSYEQAREEDGRRL